MAGSISPKTATAGLSGPTTSPWNLHRTSSRRRRTTTTTKTKTLLCTTAAFLSLVLVAFTPYASVPRGLLSFAWPQSESNAHARQLSKNEIVFAKFEWRKTPPLDHLEFQLCDSEQKLECARLKLPLDYWNGTKSSANFSIAVVRVPAQVPVSDPRYGGSILVNPGGPGGSGTMLAAGGGRGLQAIVDGATQPGSEPTKHFDIIGFDPRGIGFSTPGAHCWEDGPLRQVWMLRLSAQGNVDSSDAAAGRLYSMAHALGQSCASEAGEDDIKHFVSTSSVARDMLELTEALGKWRETQVTREQRDKLKCQRQGCSPEEVPERLRYKPGKEKLLYWGFSYGTILGSTFAAMFPDRVGRLVLDGVVWAPDYHETLWTDNLRDTEKVMDSFYTGCIKSGERCPLMRPGDDASSLKERVQRIVNSLYHNPLPIPGPSPEVITYSDVRQFMFLSLKVPVIAFPSLAVVLKAIEDRNATMFRPDLEFVHQIFCPLPNQTMSAPPSGEAQIAIACGDGDPQGFMDLKMFDEYWRKLEALSPTAGAIWSSIRLQCTGWKIRPLHRYTGPFEANTSHPILWVGNTGDPVTPLWGAKKMASSYNGSVVLTQDSVGHCSISAISLCTFKHISTYFSTGKLPAPGTVCKTDADAFGNPIPREVEEEEEVDAATVRVLTKAQEQVSKAFFDMMGESWIFGSESARRFGGLTNLIRGQDR